MESGPARPKGDNVKVVTHEAQRSAVLLSILRYGLRRPLAYSILSSEILARLARNLPQRYKVLFVFTLCLGGELLFLFGSGWAGLGCSW
jgi:hypothetical protein